jgi:hypothetical protein
MKHFHIDKKKEKRKIFIPEGVRVPLKKPKFRLSVIWTKIDYSNR